MVHRKYNFTLNPKAIQAAIAILCFQLLPFVVGESTFSAALLCTLIMVTYQRLIGMGRIPAFVSLAYFALVSGCPTSLRCSVLRKTSVAASRLVRSIAWDTPRTQAIFTSAVCVEFRQGFEFLTSQTYLACKGRGNLSVWYNLHTNASLKVLVNPRPLQVARGLFVSNYNTFAL